MNYNMKRSGVKEFLQNLETQIGAENYEKMIKSGEFTRPDDGPFLSVIMRTQGNRQQALREALTCLASQTNTDFEVILMAHNTSDEGKKNVAELIEECPHWLREKIKYCELSGGNRTAPLDKGFSEAKGEYVSIFDDDDLIFDNWVETFFDLYKEYPGKILHAYSVEQDWKEMTVNSEKALISMSGFKNIYCKDFDLVTQMSQNYCPTMSLAFPAAAYKLFGIHFNSELTTTEDWDFLMRTAFVCGVADSSNVTSIYRKWINLQNSQTVHRKKEWSDNYKKVQQGLLKCEIPFKTEFLKEYVYSIDSNVSLPKNLEHLELFVDAGNGFAGNKTAKMTYEYRDETWKAKVSYPEDFGTISRLRFDPDDFGLISIDDFKINIFDENKNLVNYKISWLRSNFVKVNGSYVFVGIDPQIVIVLERSVKCSSIELLFNLSRVLPAKKTVISSVKFVFAHFIRNAARFAYHTISKIRRR